MQADAPTDDPLAGWDQEEVQSLLTFLARVDRIEATEIEEDGEKLAVYRVHLVAILPKPAVRSLLAVADEKLNIVVTPLKPGDGGINTG